jgi:hypothetical protein
VENKYDIKKENGLLIEGVCFVLFLFFFTVLLLRFWIGKKCNKSGEKKEN